MRIKSLRKYNGRNPNGFFNDLPLDIRVAAWRWLGKLQAKWGRNLPLWRRAILIGQARRLALMSDEERSAWGRSMLAKRGGYRVQWIYRFQGRNPTAAANESRRQRVQQRKQTAERQKQAARESEMNRRIQALVNSWRWKKS
jgi:hypothetical protein